jgi:hypothetical protein
VTVLSRPRSFYQIVLLVRSPKYCRGLNHLVGPLKFGYLTGATSLNLKQRYYC